MTSSRDRACPACASPLTAGATACARCGSSVGEASSLRRARPRLRLPAWTTGDPTPTGEPAARQVLERAADPEAARRRRLTLRFLSPVLEEAFREEYRRTTVRNAPVAVALGLALIVLFGILDALLLPAVRRELWLIRYGVFAPYFLLVLGLTFVPAAQRRIESLLVSGVLVAGASIVAMILISPPPGRYLYYAGLILVIIYNFAVIRVRFALANAAGWTVVAAYLAAELAVGGSPWPILVNNTFFFVSAGILGMFAAYVAESLARQNFVQDKLVRRAREFGSYRLVSRLGDGGMGEVWRAEHHLLARPAAIKLIRADVLGGRDERSRRQTIERFEREAQATALLRSPHTVELYDFGMTEDGRFYYVMELLNGYDVQTLVRWFGPLDPARTARLLLQACHSLAEAHDAGLVHRDVKPANLHVCALGREVDFLKVLDFGIVAWRAAEDEGTRELTGERATGTPSTMAPEQILGNRAVDARTDLYGLACSAYWMLTGRQVFEGETEMQVLAAHLHSEPTPPSAHSPAVPSDLETLLLGCLEKDPDRRPSSADELATGLRACAVADQWSEEEARAWWAANPPRLDTPQPTDEQPSMLPTMVLG